MSRQGSRSGAITSPANLPIAELDGDRVRRKAAANGCENLLRAQLRTGAHWLSPGEFARACDSVGLVPCGINAGML